MSAAAADPLKLIVLGNGEVGKSSLLLRFAENVFQASIPEFETKVKTMTIDGVQAKIVLWDTVGQEKFRSITTSYYRGSAGVLLVYDVTREVTFLEIKEWLGEISRYPAMVKVLVGNKSDAGPNVVNPEKVKDLVDSVPGMQHFIVSAKTGENVEQAFMALATQAFRKQTGTTGPAEKPKGCCVLL